MHFFLFVLFIYLFVFSADRRAPARLYRHGLLSTAWEWEPLPPPIRIGLNPNKKTKWNTRKKDSKKRDSQKKKAKYTAAN